MKSLPWPRRPANWMPNIDACSTRTIMSGVSGGSIFLKCELILYVARSRSCVQCESAEAPKFSSMKINHRHNLSVAAKPYRIPRNSSPALVVRTIIVAFAYSRGRGLYEISGSKDPPFFHHIFCHRLNKDSMTFRPPEWLKRPAMTVITIVSLSKTAHNPQIRGAFFLVSLGGNGAGGGGHTVDSRLQRVHLASELWQQRSFSRLCVLSAGNIACVRLALRDSPLEILRDPGRATTRQRSCFARDVHRLANISIAYAALGC